jgi:signal transduction histidine kinase
VWVRAALEAAIARAAGGTVVKSVSTRQWEDVQPEDEAYAKAIEDTTRRLVHEIEPILGSLKLHATMEISDFRNSRTAKSLSRLYDTISAISTLGKAAAVPRLEEFDLAQLIHAVTESEVAASTVRLEFAGVSPLLLLGDQRVIGIVVANAVRNAVEATLTAHRTNKPIVITWGSTTTDYWFSVLDSGVGLPLSAGRVYDIGTTTKTQHLGMGLAICYRAARTLGGHIELRRREGSGAAFQFRWPRAYTERDQ